jgi:Asp-tRNA(Asn)/Glu-tRNA(Gln) amidotransferase A subunit family amidase
MPLDACGDLRGEQRQVANERRAYGFSPFNVEGPMGRYAQDARLLLAAMAGPDAVGPDEDIDIAPGFDTGS